MDKAKRGYQEKKQLLLKHVETEKTLTTQAQQLMDVAKVATRDVGKLHETIARRKNYDNINREACRSLDNNLNSHFNIITSNNNEYKSIFSDQATTLINNMSKNSFQCIKFCCCYKYSSFKYLSSTLSFQFRYKYETK